MPKLEIRPFTADEAGDVMFWTSNYAFHASPPFQDKVEWLERVKGRQGIIYMGAFEDGRPASVAAVSPMTQNVRGRLCPMAGVWGVSTFPQDRRKGYCKRVVARLLEACRSEGMALTTLYPFRESFYERLGYVTFPQTRQAAFNSTSLAPLLKWQLPGSVELLSIADGYTRYRAYLRHMLSYTHGMGIFENDTPEALLANTQWVAFARDAAGEIVGVMLYALQGTEITQFTMNVSRLYYTTRLGRYLLLEWIARHIDQAQKVEVRYPPTETPETWLSDLFPACTTVRPTGMGRVLDVTALDGMTVGAGSFTATLNDPLCAWNTGTWRFSTVDGLLQVKPAQQADCSLSIQGLSALLYGTHDPADFSFRGWGDPSDEVQAAIRRLFPPLTPYLHEWF